MVPPDFGFHSAYALEPRGDKDALNVDYLVNVTRNQLSLAAYLCGPKTMNRTLVDFIHSIDAFAISTHIASPSAPLASFWERARADGWKSTRIWAIV